MWNSRTIARLLQYNGKNLEEAEKLQNGFTSFILCSNRNRSALVHELLSNNSVFVYQLYEDKSLSLHAHDLIFTSDLKTVNYYSTILC